MGKAIDEAMQAYFNDLFLPNINEGRTKVNVLDQQSNMLIEEYPHKILLTQQQIDKRIKQIFELFGNTYVDHIDKQWSKLKRYKGTNGSYSMNYFFHRFV